MEHRTFLDGRVTLYPGDCLDVLDRLPANSVDAVITDPPYHFDTIVSRFGKDGAAPAKFGTDGVFSRASAGFMGKDWDGGDIAFRPETWAKVLRVLKPGGHLAAFSAPKCVHKMAFGIEAAGFEVRDRIINLIDPDERLIAFLESLSRGQADALFRLLDQFGALGEAFWTFGSGFPKNHDVSKAIDKRKDWEALPRLQGAIASARKKLGISQTVAARRMGLIGPTETLGGGGFMWFETGQRTPTREQWVKLKAALKIGDEFDACFDEAEREITGTVDVWENRSNYALTSKDGFRRDKPASADAERWAGWGTALKPAYEPIVIARKPMAESSVARQVLKTGTGAINLGAARIGDEVRHAAFSSFGPASGNRPGADGTAEARRGTQGDPVEYVGRWPANLTHDGSDAVVVGFPSDEHRFFYTAKADAHDRIGTGHPTVKPLDLMQWLSRMLCPPGGTILDLFAGSGSTGEAAYREGFNAILIEREPEYQADIARRMENATAGPVARRHAATRAKAARMAKAAPPSVDDVADMFSAAAEAAGE